MTPARHILIRSAPDGATDVYACRRRRRTHLHRAPDKTAAVAWAAALLGLRVTIAVPRHGRIRPRRIFALARLASAGLHARRGIPARHVGVRFLPLPGSRIPRTDVVLRMRPGTPEAVLRGLEDDVARHLATLSRHTGDTRVRTAA